MRTDIMTSKCAGAGRNAKKSSACVHNILKLFIFDRILSSAPTPKACPLGSMQLKWVNVCKFSHLVAYGAAQIHFISGAA